MVLETAHPEDHQYNFLIRPNRSMTAKGMTLFVVFVGVAVFLVAMRFVLLGAWVVLPFAMLEVALLAAGFWLYERASRYRETVQLSRKNILITQESVKGRKSWQFNPYWVKVLFLPDSNDWYPSQLIIGSHGEQVEIGVCLTNQERGELSIALKQAMPDVVTDGVTNEN